MDYEIVWSPKAADELSSLTVELRKRIAAKLESVTGNPLRYLEYLQKYEIYKLRVGDWRVFVDLKHAEGVIDVLSIKHRSKAYSRL